MIERVIRAGHVWLAEHQSPDGESLRGVLLSGPVDPTDDELDAMAVAGRVDAGIRASLGIEAEGSNRAVVERSASGAGKGASSARAGRGGVPGRSA